MKKDYYKILGVDKDASADTITKAYRKLAMEYHPDRHEGDKMAEERFKEIAEAANVLRDPEKREAYDTHGYDYVHAQGFDTSDLEGLANSLRSVLRGITKSSRRFKARLVGLDLEAPSHHLSVGKLITLLLISFRIDPNSQDYETLQEYLVRHKKVLEDILRETDVYKKKEKLLNAVTWVDYKQTGLKLTRVHKTFSQNLIKTDRRWKKVNSEIEATFDFLFNHAAVSPTDPEFDLVYETSERLAGLLDTSDINGGLGDYLERPEEFLPIIKNLKENLIQAFRERENQENKIKAR